jgi:drug/metabolite transporter (DMT)-like permease
MELKKIPLDASPGGRLETYLALLAMAVAVIIWGLSFISTKVVLAEIPPVSIAFFRQIIASALLIPLVWSMGGLKEVQIKDLKTIAVACLFGTVLYFVLENSGLQYTTASDASMIVAALPALTLLAEVTFFKLKVNRNMILCLAFSIVGVAMMVTVNGQVDLSSSRLFGNLLVLIATASWVIYTMVIKDITVRYSVMTFNAYQALISTFLFMPFVMPEVGEWKPISEISPFILANLAFQGIFCSAVAFILFIYALRRLGATVSAVSLNLIPAVTAICGYFWLREELSIIQVLGMVLVLASLYGLNKFMPRSTIVAEPAGSDLDTDLASNKIISEVSRSE